MANPEIVEITSLSELDDVFTKSNDSRQLLFLHDPWCPISGGASREVAQLDGPVHLINVSTRRDLSSAVADRTGIQHESPQAIILSGGHPIWDASHYEIEASNLREALGIGPAVATEN